MGKVLNFDKFMSEKTRETLTVTVFGKDYHVPMAIPAIVPVMMARAEEKMSSKESSEMVYRAADALFGTDAVNDMCAHGMSAKDMAELVQTTFNVINGNDVEDDEEQEVTDEDSHVVRKGGKPTKK